MYLAKRKNLLDEASFNKTISLIKRYKINDASLFELILSDCQALKPQEVEKQIPSKAWGDWEEQMNNFPKVFIGYLKTNKNQRTSGKPDKANNKGKLENKQVLALLHVFSWCACFSCLFSNLLLGASD